MKSQQIKVYDPTRDQQLLIVGGIYDNKGNFLDIHETLFLSEKAGFYLERQIRQVRRGRTWETSELSESEDSREANKVRFLKVLRPMSRTQVIRYVVDAYMPREGGIHLATHLALDIAGLSEC